MSQNAAFPDKISAQWLTIEVVDQNSGQTFRRELPVNYLETANGVVLTGENINGQQTSLHFLSASAIAKISELVGKGPEHGRCDEEKLEAQADDRHI